jgi:hypothetical protein
MNPKRASNIVSKRVEISRGERGMRVREVWRWPSMDCGGEGSGFARNVYIWPRNCSAVDDNTDRGLTGGGFGSGKPKARERDDRSEEATVNRWGGVSARAPE